jgi:phosphoribosylformylglycinamidine synthase
LGVQVWDVNMQDLCSGSLSLEPFKAVVFVGGFSYADVLGSAKGTIAYGDRTHTHTHACRHTEMVYRERP